MTPEERIKAFQQNQKAAAQTQLGNMIEQMQSDAKAQRDAAIRARVQEQLKEDEKERLAKTQAQDEKDVLGSLIPTITPEEQERRQRMYSARQGIAALGNGLAALGNVIYTGKNAVPQQMPEVPDGNGQQLQSWQDRLTQDRLRNTQLELAEQQRNAEEAYRAWQMQNTAEQQAQAQANEEADRKLRESAQAEAAAQNKWEREYKNRVLEQSKENDKVDNEYKRAQANNYNASAEYTRAGKNANKRSMSIEGYNGQHLKINRTELMNDLTEAGMKRLLSDEAKKRVEQLQFNFTGETLWDIITDDMKTNPALTQYLIDNELADVQEEKDAAGGKPKSQHPILDLSTISNSNTPQRPEWPRLKLNGK